MILKTLHLHNFRNFNDEIISFGPHINFIIGENGQGKTNLLEAIYLLSTGRSFKTPHLKELIMLGKNYFLIEAEIVKDLVAQTIKIYFDEDKKKVLYNSTSLPSLTSLLGILPSVLHAPSDTELITGMPSFRRRFLNLYLAQIDPLYIDHLARYHKALKQRNFLLKNQDLKSIEIWETEMAKSAAYLSLKRRKTVLQLIEPTSQIMQNLSDKNEDIILNYTPAFAIGEEPNETCQLYLNQMERNRAKEMQMKTSLFGPHRDDFICYIDKKNAKTYASEGQKRCLISSLKLAEYNLLCQRIQSPAIMNIDDVAIHLDEKRQSKLQSLIKNLNQVFITMPQHENLWQDTDATTIKIKNGSVLLETELTK